MRINDFGGDFGVKASEVDDAIVVDLCRIKHRLSNVHDRGAGSREFISNSSFEIGVRRRGQAVVGCRWRRGRFSFDAVHGNHVKIHVSPSHFVAVPAERQEITQLGDILRRE
jgi:hypothetical protein